MKQKNNKRAFGFGFDRASHSTGNAFWMSGSKGAGTPTITATWRYRNDIREAIRDIYSHASN